MEHRKRITLDAHTLIWYMHEDSNVRLSKTASEVIDYAEKNGVIYIPTIALLEVLRLIEKKKYPLSFDTLIEHIRRGKNYQTVSLDMDVVEITKRLPGLELHDRAIVATAIITDSILVSKDKEIRASGLNVIWSKRDDIP